MCFAVGWCVWIHLIEIILISARNHFITVIIIIACANNSEY